MTYMEQAMAARPLIEKAVQSLPDSDALQCRTLYPYWSRLVELGSVNTNGETGFRFYYDGDGALYKCNQANPTFQKDWIPGQENGTSALYVRVDESHAGTIDDPIPADRGMEYIYGKYYLDPKDGKIYLCQREGETEGNTVQLAYLPHELVGHFFVEVA